MGDLVHADGGGAVVMPKEIAAKVPDAAERGLAREAALIDVRWVDGFRLEEIVRRFYE